MNNLNTTTMDALGQNIKVGTAVAAQVAGDFIYGHIAAIDGDKVTVSPTIGYRTSKPAFKLKKSYKTTTRHIFTLANQEKYENGQYGGLFCAAQLGK